MGFKLADLFVSITANTKLFDSALGKVHYDLGKTAGSVGGIALATNKGANSAGLLALKFGAVSVAAVGAFKAVQSITNYLKASVDHASDLNESANKALVVFGDSYREIGKYTDDLASKFGLVKSAMLDASANFGQFFQGVGMSEEAGAGLSKQFIKLAADLSSFQNIPFEEALVKLQAGLAGEIEPLRRYGTMVSATAVEELALSQGLAKSKAELTEKSKVLSRIQIITKSLASVTGDLDRTLNGYANSVRAAAGRNENLQATIGTMLMPAMESFSKLVNEVIVDFTTGTEGMKSSFESFTESIMEKINMIGIAYRNWNLMGEIVQLKATEMLTNVGELFDWFGDTADKVITGLGKVWTSVFENTFKFLDALLVNAAKNLVNFGSSVTDWIAGGFQDFKFDWTPMLKGFEQTFETMPEIAKPHLTSLQKEIEAVGAKIAENEIKRNEKVAKAFGTEKKKPGAAAADAAKQEGKAKADKRGQTVSLEEFAKKLQEGVFGDKDKAAKDTARNTAKTVEKLDKLRVPELGGSVKQEWLKGHVALGPNAPDFATGRKKTHYNLTDLKRDSDNKGAERAAIKSVLWLEELVKEVKSMNRNQRGGLQAIAAGPG